MGRKKKIMSKIICFVMCMALVLAYVPYDAKAEESVVVLDVADGCVVITDEGYHRGNGTIIPYTGDYIITGTTHDSTHYIQLQSKAEGSTITLQDLLIDTGATVPVSVWTSMEIYADERVSLVSSSPCINFGNEATDFSIKGDEAIIIFESGANYSLNASNKNISIECSSLDFDGAYLPDGSLSVDAYFDITSTKDIYMGKGTEKSSINFTAGRNVQVMEDRCPLVSCDNMTVVAGANFTTVAHEDITAPVIDANLKLDVGEDVTITSDYGMGIYGNVSGTVGGDFVLTGYMSPLAFDMDLTAKSVYMETTYYSGDHMVQAGTSNDVNITATDGDITMKVATRSTGVLNAENANLTATNGNVSLENVGNYFVISGNANVEANNIEFLCGDSVAPAVLGDSNLTAYENITIKDNSQEGASTGTNVISFGDTYTETNANATYVIKKGNTTDYTYNGSAQYADITVTKDGAPLTSGSDFSLTYTKGDVAVAAPTDAGTYVASVKDSSGTSIVDVKFDIVPYDITSSKLALDATEFTYDGKAKTVTVTKIDDFTFNSTDFTVTGNTNTEAGEYTLQVSPKSSNFTGTATAKYAIEEVEAKEEDVAYTILSGANSTWTTEGGEDIVVRADGDFDKFVSLQVDGVTLDADDYTAVSGSTVVTLKASFLKTLKEGKHTITFVYTDGAVSTQFEVKAPVTTDGSPATGDAFSIILMLMLMSMSMLAFVTMKREHIKEK